MAKEYVFNADSVCKTLLGVMVGIAAGAFWTSNMERPRTVYERKIEGDARQYLVVETYAGRKISFVRTSSQEPFECLYRVQKAEQSNSEEEQSKLEAELLKK